MTPTATIPRFAWSGGRSYGPANDVGKIVLEIEARDGECRPRALWEAARPEDSPIHGCFNWNVQEAAEAHWTDHSRRIMRCLRIVKADGADDAPAFVPVRREVELGADRRGYVSTSRAIADPELYAQVLRDAVRQAEGLLHRYKHLKELAPIQDAVERVKHGLELAA